MDIYFEASSSVHYIILHVIGTDKPFSPSIVTAQHVPSRISTVNFSARKKFVTPAAHADHIAFHHLVVAA
jgi:hypothetical protein